MQAHPEHPHGCRGALVCPNFITIHVWHFSEQVCEFHDQCSLRPAHLSNARTRQCREKRTLKLRTCNNKGNEMVNLYVNDSSEESIMLG